jgi:hypothetical protein
MAYDMDTSEMLSSVIIGSLVEPFTATKYRLFDRLDIDSNGPR